MINNWHTMMSQENVLLTKKHILICLDEENSTANTRVGYLKNNFCGTVLTKIKDIYGFSPDKIVYLCGDIQYTFDRIKDAELKIVYIIKELSTNYEKCDKYQIISIGEVPINIHNVGVYFRCVFDSKKDYFNLIKNEHSFQSLTESNKPNNAFRKGIYLSNIEEIGNELQYNFLRCSSNLNGPTDNFRTTDNEVVSLVNNISQHFFEYKTELNHVLAQIYENSDQGKAKIKAHSDKTKDMPRDGLIAFCTFYESYQNGELNSAELKGVKLSTINQFDYCYKGTSCLTKLHFRLKHMVKGNFMKEFSVTLYPNSVFIIPLSTNRMYTHEIRPSTLPIGKLPARMGYIIRCSKTRAVFRDECAYIDEDGKCVKLQKITEQNIKELRNLYYEENVTDNVIEYSDIYYSMNDGDYKKPNL